MSEYYSLAVLSIKKVYKLGTKQAAKDTLPLLLESFNESERVILYGDETHSYVADEWEASMETIDYSSFPMEKAHFVKAIGLNREELDAIFTVYGGKITVASNLKWVNLKPTNSTVVIGKPPETKKPSIKLDDVSLKQVMKAYSEIDDVTDFLNSIYGDDWGDLKSLGNVWSDLYKIIEYHVGEDNVEEAVRTRKWEK